MRSAKWWPLIALGLAACGEGSSRNHDSAGVDAATEERATDAVDSDETSTDTSTPEGEASDVTVTEATAASDAPAAETDGEPPSPDVDGAATDGAAVDDGDATTDEPSDAPDAAAASDAPDSGVMLEETDTGEETDPAMSGTGEETDLTMTDVATPSSDAGADSVSCDPRLVVCRRAVPVCEEGEVPRIVDGCYAECVRIDTCQCTSAEACPEPERYTCINSTNRCSYYLR